MKNVISKLFLVVTLFCASGMAFGATTLNANSTEAEVTAAIQAAGESGYAALAEEMAVAQVPTQFVLNAVARTYGVAALQVVVNTYAGLGMNVAQLNTAATGAIISAGMDPATSGFTPATAAGGTGAGAGAGAGGLGGGTGGGVAFTPSPCSGVSSC